MGLKTERAMAALLSSLTLPMIAWAATTNSTVPIDADDIGGVVKSPKGPEAGVWVIAETKDLQTPFSRIVVTDDAGRYVIPDLPKAKYKVWVRGYGLVDSKTSDAVPGQHVDLAAVIAPNAKAAAEIYPPEYWSAMLKPPAPSEFPGTGPKGNGIAPGMRTQQNWIQHMQENCMFCHQFGDKATRELADTGNPIEAWDQRVQKERPRDSVHGEGPWAAPMMNNNMSRFGRNRGLAMYADWTTRIAKGEVPSQVPERPKGIERNVVVTVRDYGHGIYTHDQVASDRRHPTVNANGALYGTGMFTGQMAVLDPVNNTTRNVDIPGLDGSPHNADINMHHTTMDEKGRVWLGTITKDAPLPKFCTDGSTVFSKYYPYTADRGQIMPMYDPATSKMTLVSICTGSNHISFGWDKDSTAYLSGDRKVVAWLKTKVWDETHDVAKAYGWCPLVLDTNGDGKIDPDRSKWTAFDKGIDPKKDTQYEGFLYGINVGPDGNVWAANYTPAVPSRLVRMHVGEHAPETCVTEVYEPPMKDGQYLAFGVRGVAVDSEGVAWATFSSGHVGAFDRRKCKVTNGPTATGQQCPEGWTIYQLPGPKLTGTNITTNIVYGAPMDFENVMGLGKEAVFLPPMNSNSLLVLERNTHTFLNFTVPYPMGFYPRDVHFRIDDPAAGWKGRNAYAAYSEIPTWHQEEGHQEEGHQEQGEESAAKVAQFQLRPDPLAH